MSEAYYANTNNDENSDNNNLKNKKNGVCVQIITHTQSDSVTVQQDIQRRCMLHIMWFARWKILM